MVALPKPDVIITHESDLDGLVGGVLLQRLAEKLFGATVPLEAHHYHSWRQREPRERAAWVCDMSFEPRLDKPNWAVIDHHATELAPRHAILVHDINKSAGLLVYELCKGQNIASPELDRLVHLNNVSDLFLIDDPDFLVANDYASLVKVYGFWSIHALIAGKLEALLDHALLEVMAIKRRIEDPLGYDWSLKNVVRITDSVGYVDTVIGNTNAIIHRMLEEKATPYNVLLTIFRRPNGQMIVSMRSRNGDAIKAAEKLQGGGHANAAGATLPKSVRTTEEALDYLRHILNPQAVTPALNSLEAALSGLQLKK